jgi:fructose-bisphosphate aldolase class II
VSSISVGVNTGVERDRFLVFHGGSGSTKDEIKTAVSHGVVKMNVDTGAY